MSRSGRLARWILVAAGGTVGLTACTDAPDLAATSAAEPTGRPARVRPDYFDAVVPPNIAPLSFLVEEPASRYQVWIYADRGDTIAIGSDEPEITIPIVPWRQLLQANRGARLQVRIHTRDAEGRWLAFNTSAITVADEDIDGYLAYRLIKPIYNWWRSVGIYQRDLHDYAETPVLRGLSFINPSTGVGGCVNCHTFANNRTDRMTVGIRDPLYGSSVLLAVDGQVTKVGTRFGYNSWHPSGRLVTYSVNKVRQFFHEAAAECRDVVDLDSGLAYYLLESQSTSTNAKLDASDRLETYPTWSPDGRYLYFCSAPLRWTDMETVPPEGYDEIQYDLMRISYDADADAWGERELVLAASRTGKSILLPRVSPDGRFLLFCMCDYGCFPIHRADSDLYMMDLQRAERTGQFGYRRLAAANSDQSESWHSWSSNSRWIAFSSKRGDGLFTRTYLSYVDEDGEAHKPLVLPQRDPAFYDSFLKTYSVPELTTEPVRIREADMARAVRSERQIEVGGPGPARVTPPAGGTSWQGLRE